MNMKRDIGDLATELGTISITISGLSYHLDSGNRNRLNEEAIMESLFGISCHLERISEDLSNIETGYILTRREEGSRDHEL